MTKKEYEYIQSKLDEELNKDRNYKFLAGKHEQEQSELINSQLGCRNTCIII